MSGAFGSAALDLHARGLAVIPTGGEDGKTPLVNGWGKWRGQGKASVLAFASKFPSANLAILTGPSRLTVVDADDEKTLADAESRFGVSPIVTRSPRGGGHLYYQSNGERNANLRAHGLNIDVRGAGGMVLAPPSVRHGMGAYRIERGSWDDLGKLPAIAPGSLDFGRVALPSASEGNRNNTLFVALKAIAASCDSLEALELEAHAINAQFTPVLPREEALKVAKSIWRLKVGGKLVQHGQQRIWMLPAELESLSADAYYLLSWIKRWHGARPGPFALVPKAMVKADVIKGWGWKRYQAAILELRASGFLVRTHKGGSKPGDPSLYRMGARKEPNITNTPPPPASPSVLQGHLAHSRYQRASSLLAANDAGERDTLATSLHSKGNLHASRCERYSSVTGALQRFDNEPSTDRERKVVLAVVEGGKNALA